MSTRNIVFVLTLALVTLTACGSVTQTAAPGAPTAQPFNPADVVQGSFGDCWLLSTMYAVAYTRPSVLQDAVRVAADGAAYVGLYDAAGVRQWRLVSDPDANWYWAGNRGIAGDINWPGYIEAAWQVTRPAQSLLTGGAPMAAFDALGLTYDTLEDFDLGTLGQASKVPTVACTRNKVTGDGMVPTHCYAVTGAHDGNVSLYNPWGDDAAVTLTEFRMNFDIVIAAQ